MKIGIIIGHTRQNKGAFSPTLKQSEYDWNGDLADKMKAYAEHKKHTLLIERRDIGGITGAYARAMKQKPDCLIELHFNAADGKASGTETLYADQADKKGINEIILAKMVNDEMVSALGLKDRGLKKRQPGDRGYGNIMQTKEIPSILIESGFGDNPKDAASMQKNKGALAIAIVDACIRWDEKV